MARRYGYRYGRRGRAAGSWLFLLVLAVFWLGITKHRGLAVAVGVTALVVLGLYVGIRLHRNRSRKRFWREAAMPSGAYSVYLSSIRKQDGRAVRRCLENLDRNPAVDLDVDQILQRVEHIGAQAVVSGVSEDTAVELKKELEQRGGKVRIKEDAAPVIRHNGRRETISERVRREVWRRDGGQCVDCGSRERLEFDHIVPWSKGGSNTARNLELRCESCNRKKAAKI